MINPESAIGKPLVVYIDGERREIGVITNAAIRSGSLYIGAKLDLSEEEPVALPEENAA